MMSALHYSVALNILAGLIFLLFLLGKPGQVPQPEPLECECQCPVCTTKPPDLDLEEIIALVLITIRGLPTLLTSFQDGKSFASYGSEGPSMSDKVTEHQYQYEKKFHKRQDVDCSLRYAYQKYLAPLRKQPISLAEIGIG